MTCNFTLMLSTLMLPPQVTMIPLFVNGVSCLELLIPFVQNIPDSEMLGITVPPAQVQNE